MKNKIHSEPQNWSLYYFLSWEETNLRKIKPQTVFDVSNLRVQSEEMHIIAKISPSSV